MPKTKTENKQNIIISELDEDTTVVTSEDLSKKALEIAMFNYQNQNFRSVQFNDEKGVVNFTIDDIDKLAFNAQSNLNNIKKINNIVRFFVNKNDILGKVYESIETNVNPQWKLSFKNIKEDEQDIKDKIVELINDFNEKIDLDRLIVDAIPLSYLDGNYPMYLRKDSKNRNYHVDYYPLGVVEVSDYSDNGIPYLLVNINELKCRLQKTYKKTKKNTALFYENMEKEIKATYPNEVYKAYKNKEKYAKLDIKNSGLIRINNLKRKYGLTPIFKSLKPVIRLENIELSDDKNTLVRGKKIIFQQLVKEFMTASKDMPNINWDQAQAKAHMDLMLALKSKGTSVYTGIPGVTDVKYVEPKLEQTNVQTKNAYRSQIMTSVGVSFLSADKGSYGAAEISIKELMKMINKISKQLESILKKWYRGLLIDNGIDAKYCPDISIIDSEQLEMEIKLQLIDLLYSKLNCSYETAYGVAGIDINDEYMRRKTENEDKNFNEVFTPHFTAYTNTAKNNDDKGGCPESNNDKSKQEYDKDRQDQLATFISQMQDLLGGVNSE